MRSGDETILWTTSDGLPCVVLPYDETRRAAPADPHAWHGEGRRLPGCGGGSRRVKGTPRREICSIGLA